MGDFLQSVEETSYDIMGSGMVKLVYFAIVLVCLIYIVQSISESFWAYDSGATQRFAGQHSSSNQDANFRDHFNKHGKMDFYPQY